MRVTQQKRAIGTEMRGSIAIWHDTLADDANGYAPRVEVHINIWKGERRSAKRRFHLLDIGFRFQEMRSLRTLSISLPFEIQSDHIFDLFDVMHDSSTLSAIFNETLSAGEVQENGKTFAALNEPKKVQFYVSRCSRDDRSLTTIGKGGDAGSVIMLRDQFFDRMRAKIGDQYIRLRIRVPFHLMNGFVSEVDAKDSAFLSTISTSEIVEFRLNERRNFSAAILERLSGGADLIDVSAVHYFLIRDMTVEMTQSHTGFKKMRRLEPEIWERYLRDEPQFNAQNMIIYHWSSLAPPQSTVDSFTALATFRAYYTGRLWIYGLVVVALGAMGSASQAGLAALVGMLWEIKDPWQAAAVNAAIFFFLVFLLFFIVRFGRRWSNPLEWVIGFFSARR
ncbi:hypothetical protein NKJ31_15685 [Mesorhizobium sp. M0133]|uniref:hypothetical protein n=1 Tax=unclassified Mesorhizobium TaxID=325217 RepID=UPI00333B0D38